jgi:hypothetical protein
MTPEELAELYMSPRAKDLDTLDRYVRCTQYNGRVDWFDPESKVPLFERRPCVNYAICKSAIGSHVSFVLGEGRWPALTTATSEDDRALDDQWGLSKEDSDLVDRFVNIILVRYAKLKKVAREMLGDAMSCRSVAVVVSVKAGRLCAETVRAGWCTPTFNEMNEVTRLEIRYPYIESFFNDQSNRWDTRCMLYRRVIDEKSDTVYLPAKALDSGKEPNWAVDKDKTREHKLGFCPVVWYPFMRPATTAGQVDGVAIHEHQLAEIDGLNIALSQKQRAAITAGDPQAYEIGVAEDINPAPVGVMARPSIELQGVGPDGSPMGVFATSPSQSRARRLLARKRGAGIIWRYPDKDSKVGYLTIPADSLRAVDEHAKDLRGKVAEGLRAVFIDPSEIKSHTTLSGKALSFLFSTQLAYDDLVRDDASDGILLPLVSMFLRVVLVVGRSDPRRLYVPGVKKLLPILERFEVDVEGDDGAPAGKHWMPPRLEAVWGPYFAPNEQDQLAVMQLVVQGFEGGVITRQMAVEKLTQNGLFDVGSAAEVVEAIVEELQDQQDRDNQNLHDTMQVMNTGDGGGGGGGGNDSGSDSKPKTGVVQGAAGPSKKPKKKYSPVYNR